MPFLIPILGLFGITAAVLGGERLAANIPAPNTPGPGATTGPGLPWYIPATLVIVGGVLLYKSGAKALKV